MKKSIFFISILFVFLFSACKPTVEIKTKPQEIKEDIPTKITLDNLEEKITSLKEDTTIVLYGTMTNDDVSIIEEALKKTEYKIGLDLSNVTELTALKDYSLSGCNNLTKIILPETLTCIGKSVLCSCINLSEVYLPSSLETIDDSNVLFCLSKNLKSIIVGENNQNYSSVNGILLSKDKKTLIRCPEDFSGQYNIPSSVEIINKDAFYSCKKLTNVIMPNTVKTIEDAAFIFCENLQNFSLSSSLETIGEDAFKGCNSITSITIPSSVQNIEPYALAYCPNLSNLVVEENNQNFSSLDNVLFNKDKTLLIRMAGAKTGSYTIPNTVTHLGLCSFSNCKFIESISIPSSVTHIGESAFASSAKLTKLEIPSSVISIGRAAFYSLKNLNTLTFEDGTNWYRARNKEGWEKQEGGTNYPLTNSSNNINLFVTEYWNDYWYKN